MAKKIFGWMISLLTAVVVLLLIFILYARISGSHVSIFGYSFFKVETGSMEPDYHVGDVILVKKVSVSSLSVGSDITYISQAPDTYGMPITHRIVEAPMPTQDGRYLLVTRGIVEGARDDAPIYDDQIIGRVMGKVAFLTAAYSIFGTPIGLIVILLPLLLIILFEIRALIQVFRDRKENEDEKIDIQTK